MSVPTADTDLFSDATLKDTPNAYRSLREHGAIVRLPANDLYAITRFDVVRAALRADKTLVSSHGAHLSAGKHLARMEMEALAHALVEKTSAIEVGEPVPILNNLLQGFDSLPTRLIAA